MAWKYPNSTLSDLAVGLGWKHVPVNSSAWQDSALEKIEIVTAKGSDHSCHLPQTYSWLVAAVVHLGHDHWAPFGHRQTADRPVEAVLTASLHSPLMRGIGGDDHSSHFQNAHAAFAASSGCASAAGAVGIAQVT